MAIFVATADAIVTLLENASLGLEFTVARVYRPILDLKNMTGLHVTVMPKDQEITLPDRSRGQHDLRIDIGIQKKLGDAKSAGDNAEIDELMDFVDKMIDLVRGQSFSDTQWLKTEHTVVYAPEHLSEWRVFTSILTLTLRGYRT